MSQLPREVLAIHALGPMESMSTKHAETPHAQSTVVVYGRAGVLALQNVDQVNKQGPSLSLKTLQTKVMPVSR